MLKKFSGDPKKICKELGAADELTQMWVDVAPFGKLDRIYFWSGRACEGPAVHDHSLPSWRIVS